MDTNNIKVEDKLLNENEASTNKIKVFRRRWIILLTFIAYASINGFQWIEYSSITYIVVKYYQVSSLLVDWTTIIYMALYPIFVIPASYIIDKKGLRIAGLIGCIGTLLGTGIKVFSVRNDLFSIVLIGQAIVSASQVVIVCLPPKIAAVWFKPSEISTACSIGVLGSQIGVALGYLLPPMLVHDSTNLEEIGEGFKLLCWLLTGLMIPVTLMVVLYFPNEPPLPPSNAQASIRDKKVEFKTKSFFTSLKKLFLNKGFVIHMIGYGINIGVLSAAGTLLNQFILQYFKGANEDAGRMGFVNVFTGMVGMLIFGVILDKTHKYKEITFLTYLFSGASIVILMYTLEWKSLLLTYVACGIIGFFANAYMPVGFELAMELTFPLEESTTTGILLAMTQLLGTPFAVCAGLLNKEVGSFWTLGILAGFLFIGTVVTGCVPNKLLRQEAFRTGDSIMKRKASQYGSRLVYIP